jgi:hypothetical protein
MVPVRAAFKATCTPERYAELLNGSAEKDIPFYVLPAFRGEHDRGPRRQ